MTESMIKALYETYRRRSIQITYNQKHNITPTKALSNVKNIESVKTDQELQQDFTHLHIKGSRKKLKKLTKAEKSLILDELLADEFIKEQKLFKPEAIKKLKQQLLSSNPNDSIAKVINELK